MESDGAMCDRHGCMYALKHVKRVICVGQKLVESKRDGRMALADDDDCLPPP